VAIVVGGTGRRGTSGGGGRALGAACWCWRRGGWGGALLLLMRVLLLPMRWVDGAVIVHHPVPWRGSCHNLPLLCFLVSVDRIIHDDDIADKFWE
jgi:hypothetical protein